MGAYGFGLNFRVRTWMCACVHPEPISDIYGPILFVLGKKTTNESVHMHVILFRHQIQFGQLVDILVAKKKKSLSNTPSTIFQASIYRCFQTWHADKE